MDQECLLHSWRIMTTLCWIVYFRPSVVTQLATYVRELHSSGGMQPGEQYSATELGHRGDKVCMKGSNSPECPALQRFVQAADQLYAAVSAHVPELSDAPAPHRSQPMLAVYPGQRARYPRHVDNPDGNGRILTCIVYLNATWRAGDGGELRLAPERSKAHLDIPPVLNRLVLFWSDARVPHEVLPAHAERAACTIWFIDAGRFHDFQRGSGRLKGSEGEPAAEGTRAASAQHAGSRAGSHPTTSPSPSNAPSHTPSHAGSPLIGALESRGMAMKTHLLGAESHAALRHSFVMRLRQLQLLVDAPHSHGRVAAVRCGGRRGRGCRLQRGAGGREPPSIAHSTASCGLIERAGALACTQRDAGAENDVYPAYGRLPAYDADDERRAGPSARLGSCVLLEHRRGRTICKCKRQPGRVAAGHGC